MLKQRNVALAFVIAMICNKLRIATKNSMHATWQTRGKGITMNAIKITTVAIAIAISAASAPAMAASITKDTMGVGYFKKHKMPVHMMTMDDGTVMYGFTKAQIQQMGINIRANETAKSTDGSGR